MGSDGFVTGSLNAMVSQRCCISCRLMADRSEFWRVVRTFPDRQIQLNSGMGRSAYLCKTEACLLTAEKKDRLSRALKTPVPKDFYQFLKQQLPQQPLPSPQHPG